jgi:hypothetical protein
MPEYNEYNPERGNSVERDSALLRDTITVQRSGLFDRDWYLANHPELDDGSDPIAHFCREGWLHELQPNPYFHPAWYAKTYRSEIAPGENPLLHYIRRGERENAWPSAHFDPEWYRMKYALSEHESPLRHYLLNRFSGAYSPLPIFDAAQYLASHPDCRTMGADPYLQWLEDPAETFQRPPPDSSPLARVLRLAGGTPETGTIPDGISAEALKQVLRLFIPLIPFDEDWYCKCYPDVATAVSCHLITSAHQHFIDYGFFEGRTPAPAP